MVRGKFFVVFTIAPPMVDITTALPQYVTHFALPCSRSTQPFRHPIGEVREAGIVSASGSSPGAKLRSRLQLGLVPGLADLDPTFEQAVPRRPEIGDDEIDV
jgi:hypothetical protein